MSLSACTPTLETVNTDTKIKVDERMETDITPSTAFTTDSYDETLETRYQVDNEVVTNMSIGLESAFQY